MSGEPTAPDGAAGEARRLRPLAAWRTLRMAGGPRIRRGVLAAFALIILAVFAGTVWVLYARGQTAGAPLRVEAPEKPVKVRPEDRGGMAVPHRDKLVFNRLSERAGDSDEPAIRLRGGAEMPLARPRVPELEPSGLEPAAVVGAGARQSERGGEAGGQNGQESEGESTPFPSDAWRIQVAAFQQRRHARGWMVQVKNEHAAVFEGLESAVVEGYKNRARYYRVRFGPFADRAAAKTQCEAVEDAGLNCLLVAPE